MTLKQHEAPLVDCIAVPRLAKDYDDLCTLDPELATGMEYFSSIYEEFKAEDALPWEEMRPRVEKRVVYLYNQNLLRRTIDGIE